MANGPEPLEYIVNAKLIEYLALELERELEETKNLSVDSRNWEMFVRLLNALDEEVEHQLSNPVAILVSLESMSRGSAIIILELIRVNISYLPHVQGKLEELISSLQES